MQLSVNISTVYRGTEAPLAIQRAERDGFAGVEIQVPYDTPTERLAEALEAAGLPLILINLPFREGHGVEWPAIAADGEDQFLAGLERACRYAQALKVPMVNALAGVPEAGEARQAAFDRYCRRLERAERDLKSVGATTLVEPVNTNDVPGFLITTCQDAIAAIDASGGGRRMQFDIYHSHQMEDDAFAAFNAHVARIGHVQFSDHPGRREPGTGKIDFQRWFDRLSRRDHVGVTGGGWVGAEYNCDPSAHGQQSWMSRYPVG